MLLADDVDADRLIGHTLGLVGLGLLHDLAGDEDLLDNAPGRRGDVVQDNAHRDVPAKPDHHKRHDSAHDLGLACLRGVRLRVEQHGNERKNAERKNEQHVDPGTNDAERANGVVGRDRKGLKDAIEVGASGIW